MIIINKKIKFFSTLFYKIIAIIFAVMMFIIVFMNLFIDRSADYVCKNSVSTPNFILLIIGFAALSVGCLIYYKFVKNRIDKLTKKECNIILIIACFVILILQLYFAYNIYFLSGWDVGVMRASSIGLGNNELLNTNFGFYSYYAQYPNNIFLTFIFTLIYKFVTLVGINHFDFIMVLFSTVAVNISIFFIAKCAQLLLKNRHLCIFTIIVYVIYIAFSPWITIPYSDTYATMFTTGALFFYLNKNSMNRYIAWFLIFVGSLIGYLIKPTCIIILIAIVLIELWKFLFIENKLKIKKISIIPSILMALIVFMGINIFSMNSLGYEKNKDTEIPMTHFLMMGMNSESKGVYNQDDVNFTNSHVGKDNKVKANLNVVKNRLLDYGVSGYLNLLGNKLLTNYNDGTFAWGVEGGFYSTIFEQKNRVMSPVLREICYNDGKYYDYYATYQQCIWITILVLVLCSIKKIAIDRNDGLYAVVLTVIGITLFLLLFEARARYLYLYSPYFIILATVGLNTLICSTKNQFYLKNKI